MKEYLERAATFLLEGDLVREWTNGAIFPTEMAFFLALCEGEGVRIVIESGRENGFSTLVLGHWMRARGGRVVSIDWEEFPEVAARCHARLSGYPVQMVKGDGFNEVGRAVRSNRGQPIALLLDGPKGFDGLAIAAATASDIRLSAFHNLNKDAKDRVWFQGHGGQFYEQQETGPEWARLRASELQHCHPENRTIAYSTLGAVTADAMARWPLLSPAYGVMQPLAMKTAWSMGAYGAPTSVAALRDRVVVRLRRLSA